MKRKRKRPAVPLMLFWNKRDQLRFIDAVERLVSIAHDLGLVRVLFEETMRACAPAPAPRRRRSAAAAAAPNGEAVPT